MQPPTILFVDPLCTSILVKLGGHYQYISHRHMTRLDLNEALEHSAFNSDRTSQHETLHKHHCLLK